jgi:tRNA threonylcarbamoyl adenosine modification protein (Sua5/YciO/YrdC/YwlC family)
LNVSSALEHFLRATFLYFLAMLVQIFPDNIDDRKIAQAVECLRKGGVIIYPTDTVYSMGCALDNPKAIERVARLKGIKAEKANFSIVCSDLSHLTDYSKQVENYIFKLMKSLLPGPYTFILEASRNIPKYFAPTKKTIGIRIPDHPIALRLVRELGCPIIATSVHDDDTILEYTTDPERIYEKWEKDVDMVIDGGPGGFEVSTILDCTGGGVTVARKGKGPVDGII